MARRAVKMIGAITLIRIRNNPIPTKTLNAGSAQAGVRDNLKIAQAAARLSVPASIFFLRSLRVMTAYNYLSFVENKLLLVWRTGKLVPRRGRQTLEYIM